MNTIQRLKLVLKRASTGGKLQRATSTLGILFLGIGGIIGSGIFVLTGQAAATSAGPAVVLSFLLGGCAAFLAAMCYASIARVMPVAGGAFAYSYVALGELFGWTIGWDLQLEYLVGNSMVGAGWSSYFYSFMHDILGIQLPRQFCETPFVWDNAHHAFVLTGSFLNLPALLMVGAVTALLCLGLRETARANTVIVIIKLAVILLFIGFTAPFIHTKNLTPFIPPNLGSFGKFGWSGVVQGAGLVFFSYVGFDSMATSSQELKNPEKSLPIAMFVSLLICTTLYVLVAFVLTGVVPYKDLAVGNPLVIAVHETPYHWLNWVVEGGALAGLTASVILGQMAHPRICLAMSQNHLLPAVFAKVSPKHQTPVLGTLICGAATATIAALVPIQILNELVSVGTLVGFAAVSLAVIVLRRGKLKGKITGVGGFIPVLSLVVCLFLIVASGWRAFIRIGIWFLIGMPIFASRRFFKKQAKKVSAS